MENQRRSQNIMFEYMDTCLKMFMFLKFQMIEV